MSKYSFEEVSDLREWDEFVKTSPQGTIFSLSDYLNSLGQKYRLWFVKKGRVVKAAFHAMLSDSEKELILDEYVIYEGIMFSPDDPEQKRSKINSDQFSITEFIVEAVTSMFESIEISLSPQFKDVRPFLWHNYHSSDASCKFCVDNRYTSFLDISELNEKKSSIEDYDFFNGFEVLRKRNIRKALKNKVKVDEEQNVAQFIEFYRELMIAQNSKVDESRLAIMENLLVNILEKNLASMYVGKSAEGKIAYITVFCYDNKRAYYLFGAGCPELREHYIGSYTFLTAFFELAKKGIREVDLEGINSPQRGAFKLSFGGTIDPYFELVKG